MADKVLADLTKAAGELLYPSETDAPFAPFTWEGAENTESLVRRSAALPRAAKCQQLSLDELFGDLLEEKEFRGLRTAIETILDDVKVYRFGSIRVTYYIVGTAGDGRLAGLKTTAVET